jgi:hypothetical protein
MVNPFYMLIAGGIVTFSQGADEAPRTLRVFHPARARAAAEAEPV